MNNIDFITSKDILWNFEPGRKIGRKYMGHFPYPAVSWETKDFLPSLEAKLSICEGPFAKAIISRVIKRYFKIYLSAQFWLKPAYNKYTVSQTASY